MMVKNKVKIHYFNNICMLLVPLPSCYNSFLTKYGSMYSLANRRDATSDLSTENSFLYGYFLAKSLKRISSLNLRKLDWRVLIQEFIDAHISSANSDLDLVLEDTDADSLGAKVVDPFVIPHEQNFQLAVVRVIVDKICHAFVDWIVFDGHIHRNSGFQVDNVILEGLVLCFEVAHSFEQPKTSLIGPKSPTLEFLDVISSVF